MNTWLPPAAGGSEGKEPGRCQLQTPTPSDCKPPPLSPHRSRKALQRRSRLAGKPSPEAAGRPAMAEVVPVPEVAADAVPAATWELTWIAVLCAQVCAASGCQ